MLMGSLLLSDWSISLVIAGTLPKYIGLYRLTFSGWIIPQNGGNYDLRKGGTLNLKTTANHDEHEIRVNYLISGKYYYLVFGFRLWSTTWTYVIDDCTIENWREALYMNGIPSDEIKVWQITKTSTSLVVVCNGVTVANFIFAVDGRSGCHEVWSRESTSFRLSMDSMYRAGTLFLRIEENCKLFNYEIRQFCSSI